MRSCCKALWIKVDYLLLHILAATVSDSGLPLPVSPSPAPPRMSLRPIHYTCPPSDSRFWISWWNCVLGSDLHVFLYLSLDPGVRLWRFVVLTCLSLPPGEDILHPPPDIHWSWWSLICSVLTWFRLPSKNPSSLTWPGPQSQSPYSTALYLTPLTVYHSPVLLTGTGPARPAPASSLPPSSLIVWNKTPFANFLHLVASLTATHSDTYTCCEMKSYFFL